MRLLLSGVGGFIGSHFLEHVLENTDWEVVGVASWRHKGTPERIEEVLSANPQYRERVTVITHDLESPFTPLTKKRIGQVDYIVNFAAESHVDRSITDPVPFITNNVNVALTMLEFAREANPQCFLQISTDEVYGPAPMGVNHPEWSAIIPSNPYSASKACQEAIATAYWRTYNIPLVITNTMNNFGEMQDNEKFVPLIIKKVEEGGIVPVHGKVEDGVEHSGSRYYLHARNHADAILFILKHLPPKLFPQVDRPDRYNVVGDIEMNNLDMARTVARLAEKPLNYTIVDFHGTRPGHDPRYALDGTKLKNMGWHAPLSFLDSLKRTIEWTRQHRLWL